MKADANRGKRKARPANSVRRTRHPEGTQPTAEMRRASDPRRQASPPSYGARRADDLRDIGSHPGQPGAPGSQRSCRARSASAHNFHAQAWKRRFSCASVGMTVNGSADQHTYERLAQPAFSSCTRRNWQWPDLLQEMLRRHNAQHGNVSSQGKEGQGQPRGCRLRTRSNL